MAKDEDKPYKMSAQQLFEKTKNREIITTTLGMDIGLSGGIVRGSTTILAGVPKSGKSTYALFIGAKAQRKYDAKILYYSLEGRLTSLLLSQIPDLQMDKDHFEVFMPPPIEKDGKVIGFKKWTSEHCLTHIGKSIENNPGSVIIVDSISNLISEKEQSEDLGYADMGQKNKIEAAFSRRFIDLVVPNGSILILIAQVITNIGQYGFPFKAKIGTSILHACDYNLIGKSAKKWDEQDGRIRGHTATFGVIASALGQPHLEAQLNVEYGNGPDEAKDIVEHALNWGLAAKSGSWFELPFVEDNKTFKFTEIVEEEKGKERPKYVKVQGEIAFKSWLRNNREQMILLDSIIRKKIFG